MKADESATVSRRNFGRLMAVSGAAVPALRAQEDVQHQAKPKSPNNSAPPGPGNFRRPLVPDTPPFEGKLEFARKDVELKALPFPMANVRLLPGSIFHDAQEWN